MCFVALLFLLQWCRGIGDWLSLCNFLSRETNHRSPIPKLEKNESLPFFYIFIPVIREQQVLRDTVVKLLQQNYPGNLFQVVIITTEKEQIDRQKSIAFQQFPSTVELAQQIKEEINYFEKYERIRVIHYPYVKGVMGHQVNYAAQLLVEEGVADDAYMALYNADSRLSPRTLQQAASEIRQGGNHQVLQQLAFYVSNYPQLNQLKGLGKYVLMAGGLYQSVYTICQEYALLNSYNNSLKYKKPTNIITQILHSRAAYCIGHGMFIQLHYLKSLGWLPTETMNEDLPFGFLLVSRRVPIKVLSVFEYAETPNSLRSLINQKKVWFWSYLEYPRAFSLAKERFGLCDGEIRVLLYRGLVRGIMWLFLSIIYVLPIVFGIVFKSVPILIISLCGLFLLQVLPSYVIFSRIHTQAKKDGVILGDYTWFDRAVLSVVFIFILFTDSLGPWLTVWMATCKRVFGIIPEKRKTER